MPELRRSGTTLAEQAEARSPFAIAAVAVPTGIAAAIAYLLISRSFPVPIVIGAFPMQTAVALGLGISLLTLALLARPASRKPEVSMDRGDLYRIFFWWTGASLTLLLFSFASWRQWGAVCLFVAIGLGVKAASVFTYIKQDWEFGVWQPFAVIMGLFALVVGIGLYLSRSDVPPPINAALDAYAVTPHVSGSASRKAPDLSSYGYILSESGDGNLGGRPTTLFIYEAKDQTPVLLYEAAVGFPSPLGSYPQSEPSGWGAHMGNAYFRGFSAGGHFMAVAYWEHDVDSVARALAG
jgi:hypothetical protein